MNIMNIDDLPKTRFYLKLIKSPKSVFKNLLNQQPTKKLFSILLIFASLTLSGCVKYDLGINFNHTNNGELVQHIKLSENLNSFSGDYVEEWLNSIARRSRKLSGSAKRISPEEMIIKIPFTNGKELEEKYNDFFSYRNQQNNNNNNNNKNSDDTTKLPNISSNLIVQDNNFLLLSRNHLIYDLDLRSLSALTTKGNTLNGNSSILNLDFSLQTPWEVKNIQKTEDVIQPEKTGKQLIWKLQPGKLNHVEVVFWTPNILGIGTLIIILFVWGGYYLRHTLLESELSE
jgi:hypothetical protein